MTWLKNLWENGTLGTVETDVEVKRESVVMIAIAAVLVAVIIMVAFRLIKKV